MTRDFFITIFILPPPQVWPPVGSLTTPSPDASPILFPLLDPHLVKKKENKKKKKKKC